MSPSLDIWSLPTAARLLSGIADELAQGISQCLVIPRVSGVSELSDALRRVVGAEGDLQARSVHLTSLESLNVAGIQRAILGPTCEVVGLEDWICHIEAPDVNSCLDSMS